MKINIISVEHDGDDAVSLTIARDRGTESESLYTLRVRVDRIGEPMTIVDGRVDRVWVQTTCDAFRIDGGGA